MGPSYSPTPAHSDWFSAEVSEVRDSSWLSRIILGRGLWALRKVFYAPGVLTWEGKQGEEEGRAHEWKESQDCSEIP